MLNILLISSSHSGTPFADSIKQTMKSLIFLLFAFVASTSLADTLTRWTGRSDITFSGTSTLHEWAGNVSTKPFTTTVTTDPAGKPRRIQAEVSVESVKMDTAEPKRDENMRKAMKTTEYPLIQASLDVPADQIAPDGKTPSSLPLKITLLGKTQKIVGKVTNWQLREGKATFELDFDVSMKASGISVPAVLLFIRVGDSVKVHAAVTLTQS